MLTRRYIKIASTTKTLLRNGIVLNKKYIKSPCICNNYNLQLNRQISCDANLRHVAKTVDRNEQKVDFKKSKAVSSEEVLEKFIAGLSTDIYQKNRVYKNDFLRVVDKVRELNFSTLKQGLLLIRCCSDLMPDESPGTRMALVEIVWKTIMPHTKFQVEHYNELLNVYIANHRTLTASTFIEQMVPVKATATTYELILKALGEAGDLNQATEVISNMKTLGFPANENIFISLIICQGKVGKVQSIQDVLTMMKSLKIEHTVDTYTAIARALAFNGQEDLLLDRMAEAQRLGVQFTEKNIMEIVKTLSSVNLHQVIPKVLKYLPQETLSKPSISPYMQNVATQLVFQNNPIAALEIYKCLSLPSFGPKDDKGLHGRSLVRDCVKAGVPSSVIALVTRDLMASGRNPIALQNAAEAALQQGKVPLALDMLGRMKQMGIPLRPHYFWPIMIQNCRCYGEKGIMNTLTMMAQMDVMPDYETIIDYTIPYVSFTSPQNLMKKFQETGLTISAVLTPMMETLLHTGQVRAASELCELFRGKIDAEKLLKPLVKGYLTSADLPNTIHILQDIKINASDKNKDWTGRFLCNFMQHKKVAEDLCDVLNLLRALKDTPLRISSAAADYCVSRVNHSHSETELETFRNCIIWLTDERVADDGDLFNQQIPHPKVMNEEALRAHLIELEAKGMNTRGVLRKLLQLYCREGNYTAAKEIANRCKKEQVFLSPGMKASIFDLHIKLSELEEAEAVLADICRTAPNFVLDEFKVIDLATLMVFKKKIKKAMGLIVQQSKRRNVIGGNAIAMNCWRLLDATAANGNHLEVRSMLNLLIKYNYCKPTNVILGPLIRVHLKNENLQEAVNEFVDLSIKYRQTPLKHELLCKILLSMGEGESEDKFLEIEKANGRFNKLARTVLEVDKNVHGPGDIHLTLIAALADVNYKKTVRKLFLDPAAKLHPDALKRRCERFAVEKKVHALENIAEGAKDLRHFNIHDIYELILDIYQRDDNYKGAMALWTKMQESDFTPSKKFVQNLCALIKSSNNEIPGDLAALLDQPPKKELSKSTAAAGDM